MSLYRLHRTQTQIRREAKRFNVITCGRRWGKSLMGKNNACETALDKQPVGWFSPTYKLLLEEWRDINAMLNPIILRANITERRIELTTGGVIEFWAVDTPDVARGRKYKRVIIDEAAMMRYLKDAWEFAIRPTLTDLRGDAYFFSTPKGRNYFFELFTRGQDPDNATWKSWQFPTSTNPYIPRDEIELARLDLPELAFKQEYMAEFLENEGAVFRNVYDAATVEEPGRHDGHSLFFGVDWGKQNDFTVIVCVCSTCRQMVFMDRFNKIDYAFQRKRLHDHAHRWKPYGILPERNSMGEPIIEELQREGLNILPGPDGKPGYFTSATNKPQLIEDLALVIERGELQILNNPVLIGEMLAYERTASKSGRPSYNAPEGMHDDSVMALALAWNAAGKGGLNLYTLDW